MTELNILSQEKNSLFDRKEVQAIIKSGITPNKLDLIKALAKKLSTQEDNIKIKSVTSKFGSDSFDIRANVYSSKEDKNNTEKKTKKEIEAEKKAAEEFAKAAAEAKAQAKAEKEAKTE